MGIQGERQKRRPRSGWDEDMRGDFVRELMGRRNGHRK